MSDEIALEFYRYSRVNSEEFKKRLNRRRKLSVLEKLAKVLPDFHEQTGDVVTIVNALEGECIVSTTYAYCGLRFLNTSNPLKAETIDVLRQLGYEIQESSLKEWGEQCGSKIGRVMTVHS